MRRIFADAVYWVAIANRKDQWYTKVVTVMRSLGRLTLVTTEEVLDEFLAHYSGHGPVLRNLAAATVEKAMANPLVIVRPQSHQSFLDGLALPPGVAPAKARAWPGSYRPHDSSPIG